jgi:hypothetical protein
MVEHFHLKYLLLGDFRNQVFTPTVLSIIKQARSKELCESLAASLISLISLNEIGLWFDRAFEYRYCCADAVGHRAHLFPLCTV